MPKKKKSIKFKKTKKLEKEKSPLWSLSWAVLTLLIALVLLIGALGTGGFVPVKLFHLFYTVFGWAAYITPFILIYIGIYLFKSEKHVVPIDKIVGLSAILLFSSGFFFSSFAEKNASGSWTQGHGGFIGKGIGNLGLLAFDKIPASIILFVLGVLSILLTLAVTPTHILNLLKLFKKSEEDSELSALKAKAGDQNAFQLNEGVPVEHHGQPEAQARLSSLRNTAQKLTSNENHEALTTTTDPTWQYPSINLLNQKPDKADPGNVNGNAQIIRETLNNFNIDVDMEGANVGPRITQYTLKPPTGVKLTKITALENNLALDLAAHSIRIEAPIPGKRAVGIEVPNLKSATVRLSSMFTSRPWQDLKSPLAIAIGKDISGMPVVADLDRMPHLLVAGQTGSGKSVM
ncbi:MAG TPA: DNA translocase FtsK 4TM domain-containing protein, partial [Patescibacteria group bacterium]|nr:DNA translocase FtsK 4TM domain-containing protein [Patescibacteria group bacterium]